MDYSNYHSQLAGLQDQGSDVLHEVLSSLLTKDEKYIEKLYNKKGNKGLRELDFFILRMIKLNCHSLTSPYRWKYKQGSTDENQQDCKIESPGGEEWWIDEDSEGEEIKPEEEPKEDNNELICARFEIIRKLLESLPVTEREKEIFRWKFFHDCSWKEWRKKENPRHLQATYRKVRDLLTLEVKEKKRIYRGVVTKAKDRSEKVIFYYQRSLFPGAYIYSKKYKKALRVADKYLILLKQLNS